MRAPARTWFDLYAQRVGSVGINNTFYRLVLATTVEGWAAEAPPGFTYAVKLGQFGSHWMKPRDAVQGVGTLWARVRRPSFGIRRRWFTVAS